MILLSEAGLLKVILDGSLDYETETIQVNSIDSLKNPLNDFFEHTLKLLEKEEKQQSINHHKLFIVVGCQGRNLIDPL
ncbi:hypothetical protein BSNK01_22570 [Bacillaceae bacterium]